jgi:hypothetical protein
VLVEYGGAVPAGAVKAALAVAEKTTKGYLEGLEVKALKRLTDSLAH